MIERIRRASARSLLGVFTFFPILALFALILFAPPDGNERAQLLQFVGRFHPLTVHLPIALLILVPVLELAGRTRYFPHVLPAVDFLLGVAVCGAIAAAFLGWCLGRSGAYSGTLMTQHMWGGALVATAAWACWFVRENSRANSNHIYAGLLFGTVALVSFTGYRGGQLSQGENHLTEFMPAPLATVLRVGLSQEAPVNSPYGGPNTFYGARIQPVFSRQCVSCHGRSKHKANLRLDSYEAVIRGSKHGAVIKPGEPKGSELLHRVTLPPADDDFMPADKKRPLSAADVKLIELWIALGASGTLPTDAIKDVPSAFTAPAVAEVTIEDVDLEAVAKQRANLALSVAQFQKKFPSVLGYQSRGSADLVVHAAWMGSKFGDSELAALAPLSERITMADFSNTAITDKSATVLASMKNLRTLRLVRTKITDTTLRGLTSLNQLEILSIFDTAITPAGVQALHGLPKLQRVYASGTKISADALIGEEIKEKLIF